MSPLEQKAFVQAYGTNVASASDEDVTEFVRRYMSGEDVDYSSDYTSIVDALGMWRDAKAFAIESMKKKSLIDQVLDQIGTDYEKGDLTAVEELLLKVDENILRGYLPEGV
jgi:hypothetical protein